MRAVAQRVGQVGGTAAELLHLDVLGQLGAPLGEPCPHRVDVEPVLVAYPGGAVDLGSLLSPIAFSRAACLRITWSYAARSASLSS